MRRSAFIISIISLGLFMTACAPKTQDDCGYVQNSYGERISWKGQVPVVMSIHSSVPAEYATAIKNAAQSWNKASGKTLIKIADEASSADPDAVDHVNTISFASTWDDGKLSEQAKTSVHWVGDQIQEADIKINGAKSASGTALFQFYTDEQKPNAINMEALVLHEMGHVLGLKHKDRDASVMATYLASDTDRTQLAATDKDSLQCEY